MLLCAELHYFKPFRFAIYHILLLPRQMKWSHLQITFAEVTTLLVFSVLCSTLFMNQELYYGNDNRNTLNVLMQFTDFLSRWKIGVGVVSVHVLDLMGSLLCCRTYRLSAEGDKHWLESLISCTIMQFGGTSLAGIMLGQPGSWMLGYPSSPLALLLAWWLVFCCPQDLFSRMMGSKGVAWRLPELLSAVSGGHAVTTWGVDKVSPSQSKSKRVLVTRTDI